MEKHAIFKAVEVNWSQHSWCSWQYTNFIVYSTGELHISVEALENVVECKTTIRRADFNKIVGYISDFNNGNLADIDPGHCCDGVGWGFVSYNEEGAIIREKELGYIYGLGDYENMAELLLKYVPMYEIPDYFKIYSEEEIEEIHRKQTGNANDY